MTPKEFTIKKFENNHPDLIKIIEYWTDISIEKDLDEIHILLHPPELKGYPKEDTFNKEGVRETYAFMVDLGSKVADYLIAKGFPQVSRSYGGQLQDKDGFHKRGTVIKAYTTKTY